MTEVERLCMEKKCITCFHWEPSEHRPLGICHRANSVTDEGYFCGMWHCGKEMEDAVRDGLGSIRGMRIRNSGEGGGRSL